MINRIESPLLNFKVYKICLKMNKDRDTSYRNSIQLKISKIIFFKRNFVYFKNKLLIFNVAKKKRLDNEETCLDPMTNIDKFVKVDSSILIYFLIFNLHTNNGPKQRNRIVK